MKAKKAYYDFKTAYDVVKPDTDYKTFYKHFKTTEWGRIVKLKKLENKEALDDIIPVYNQFQFEEYYIKLNRPYYKLDNNLVPWFLDTKLNVPGQFFKLPQTAFVIRLSEDHDCPELKIGSYKLRSILVADGQTENMIKLQNGVEPKRTVILYIDIGETLNDPIEVPIYTFQNLRFDDNDTIELALEKALKSDVADWLSLNQGQQISIDFLKNCMRIAAATCFLATSADKIVEPDVLNSDLQKYIENRNNREIIKKLQDKAKRRGKFGWVLGRETIFPNKTYYSKESDSKNEGRELRYQHQRSGHFHVVKYGPNKADGKVVWYTQLTVRSDLPIPPIQVRKGKVAK